MTEETGKKPASRRKSRTRAFECLYGLIFESAVDERSLKRVFDRCPVSPGESVEDGGSDYAWVLVQGVWSRERELDAVIGRFSKNWKLARIAKVDLTILRLAMFEILHQPDMPLRVAINEAIELAKRYGDDNSPGFVNGILDAVAKAVDHGEFEIRKGL